MSLPPPTNPSRSAGIASRATRARRGSATAAPFAPTAITRCASNAIERKRTAAAPARSRALGRSSRHSIGPTCRTEPSRIVARCSRICLHRCDDVVDRTFEVSKRRIDGPWLACGGYRLVRFAAHVARSAYELTEGE